MKNIVGKTFSTMLATAFLITAMAFPSNAESAQTMDSPLLKSQTAEPILLESRTFPPLTAGTNSENQTTAILRTCQSGYFGFANFPVMHSYISNTKGWFLNSKNVWQSPSDNATWELYCVITKGTARMHLIGSTTSVTPSPVYLGDGTRIDFRTVSSSGGYTIDINVGGVIYKVHRI